MSYELLLNDAKKLKHNPMELNKVRENISQTPLSDRKLTYKQFHELVFMIAPSDWRNEYPLRSQICGKTLETIVKDIRNKGNNPLEVFYELSKQDSWFERYFVLSARFDPRLMERLWIRDLYPHENQQGSFYIEDGCHRSLVYAMYIHFKQLDYEESPALAYHTSTWKPILPWSR